MPTPPRSFVSTPSAEAPEAAGAAGAPDAADASGTARSSASGLVGTSASQAPQSAPKRRVDVRRVPQQARGQETVKAVLRAANHEIQRAGLDHLSTKRIAAAAGLSVGSLYGYFPNKESIVAALLESWLQRVYDAVDSVHPRHGGGRDIFAYLREQFERALAVYEEQPGVGALFGMAAGVPALHETIHRHGERTHESIASALGFYAPNASLDAVHSIATTVPLMCHHLITAAQSDPRINRQCMVGDLQTCLVALGTRLLLPPAPAAG